MTRMLGCIAVRQGQYLRARQLFLESLSLGKKLVYGDITGDPGGNLAFVLWTGSLAEAEGKPVLAARLHGAVEGILETFFKALDTWDIVEVKRIKPRLVSALDEDALSVAWAAGRKLTLDQALEEALEYAVQEGDI